MTAFSSEREFEVYRVILSECDRHRLEVDLVRTAQARFRCGCGNFSGMVVIGSLVPADNVTLAVNEWWRRHVSEAIAERLAQVLRPRKKFA